ncbi:DUF808 family protein [Vibrio lentus]|nr:DUF808 family protein [Vibrio lentus]
MVGRDLGFYLQRTSNGSTIKTRLGNGLVAFAPKLMKMLAVVGTAAMFLVGGGIVVHNVPAIHHLIEPIIMDFRWTYDCEEAVVPTLLNGVIGVLAGLIVVAADCNWKNAR